MKKVVKKLPLILIATSLIVVIIMSLQPRPEEVDLAKVDRGSLRITVEEDGVTRIRRKCIISAPLAGQLARIDLKPGMTVDANSQRITSISPVAPTLLDARAREQAKARVSIAQASIERAKTAQTKAEAAIKQSNANKRRAEAEVNYTRSEHVRIKKLYDNGRSASDQELSTAYFQMRRAEQELIAAEFAIRVAEQEQESARFSLQVARHELQLAQAALLRTSKESPTELTSKELGITSPISGRVLKVFQESKKAVQPGDELIEIGDPTDLEIVVDVLSSDAVKITPGDKVELHHWGRKHTLHGEVVRVEPQARTKISALGVEEQRVDVIINFTGNQNLRKGLGDGFRVDAKIVILEKKDVVKVHSGALFRHGKGRAVYVRENGKATLRLVEIGEDNGIHAEVIKGLKPGEEVVLYPSDKIKDGALITTRMESHPE